MTDSEKFDLILSEIQSIKTEVHGTKEEIQGIKAEIQGIKAEIQSIKAEIQDIKAEIEEIKRRTTSVELHIENTTDKNIQLMAENLVELINKLNQAIPCFYNA